jgi:hypothetical protein
MATKNIRLMTRATLARTKGWPGRDFDGRHVMGPVYLRTMPGGKLELFYSTKGCGTTVAILDADEPKAIDDAIDSFISTHNYYKKKYATRGA